MFSEKMSTKTLKLSFQGCLTRLNNVSLCI